MKIIRKTHKLLPVILIFFSVSLISCVTTFPQSQKSPFYVGDLVHGSEYRVRVVNVERIDKYLKNTTLPEYIHPLHPDHNFLVVDIEFFKNGERIRDKDKLLEEYFNLSVIDSEEKIYPVLLKQLNADSHGEKVSSVIVFNEEFFKETGKSRINGLSAFFSVPKTATGFNLKYRDLPTIYLESKKVADSSENVQQPNLMYKVGDLVQGRVYGIKVIEVEKTNQRYSGNIFAPISSPPDQIFLKILAEFFAQGVTIKDVVPEIKKLSVIDGNGKVIATQLPDQSLTSPVEYNNETKQFEMKDSVEFFISVPKDSSGLKLRYRDLSLIDLGL